MFKIFPPSILHPRFHGRFFSRTRTSKSFNAARVSSPGSSGMSANQAWDYRERTSTKSQGGFLVRFLQELSVAHCMFVVWVDFERLVEARQRLVRLPVQSQTEP
jgi:hypothetical protein